jgi:hypothetical protein
LRGESRSMLLKHRPPGIDSTNLPPRGGFEHLEPASIAVLRWLNANRIDYVLVGPVARAIRGESGARGPVAIVPAPYDRNYERLTRALVSEHAGLRGEQGLSGADASGSVPVKLTPGKLARGRRWLLRCGLYDLDVERACTPEIPATAPHSVAGSAHRPATPAPVLASEVAGGRYQELLYEANRFELADGVSVEVASPEDLEHYTHINRTGTAPEFRVTRNVVSGTAEPAEGGSAGTAAE